MVRRRAEDDIAGCVRALAAVQAADGYPTAWPADPESWLNPPGATAAWVAEIGGVIVGHVCVGSAADAAVVAHTGAPADRLAAVKRLFTTPAARRRGVAAALLDAASAHAAEHGLALWLDVVDGEPAVEFYERLGWLLVDRRPADWMAQDGLRRTMRIYVAPVQRVAARVLLVDAAGRVLLFHGSDPRVPGELFWFTVGGGVEPDEDLGAAALREMREETGIRLDPDRLVGPVWRRAARFAFDGVGYRSDEWFFLAVLAETTPAVDTSGFTELETDTVHGRRWWSADELRRSSETIYPAGLGELLPELLGDGWDGRTRTVE